LDLLRLVLEFEERELEDERFPELLLLDRVRVLDCDRLLEEVERLRVEVDELLLDEPERLRVAVEELLPRELVVTPERLPVELREDEETEPLLRSLLVETLESLEEYLWLSLPDREVTPESFARRDRDRSWMLSRLTAGRPRLSDSLDEYVPPDRVAEERLLNDAPVRLDPEVE
jgi:hypothetical protein